MPEYDPIAELQRRLQSLEPIELEIHDDSAAHAGHAGAAGGGHYRVRLVSPRFSGLSRVQRHRLVFAAAGDLMQKGIHALAVTALAPGE
ncbi:MAG: BolA family transcriptional regulator [Rhodocyclales bacterium]|nr:BolA family transcriptional regulator [Rhodocyclales bacterium]